MNTVISMTIFEMVLGILFLIMGGLLCYIAIGTADYTVFEYIPWKGLSECDELNISNDQFVWNSPRIIPDEVKNLVVNCHSSAFSYEGSGIPLFKLGRFNPPSNFKIGI